MNLQTALRTLKLNSQATRDDVKQAYRRLAAQWHPDLHAQNPKMAPKAVKKMQELNSAYAIALGSLGSLPSGTAKKNTASPTVSFNSRFTLFLLSVVGFLALVALLFFLYYSRSTDKTSIPSPSRAHSTIKGHPRQIFKSIDFQHFNQDILKNAQLHLATIGFPTGKIDGIFGPQSIAAINSFHTAFSSLTTFDTPEILLRILAVHAQIATAHPNWLSIVQSDDFHTWLARPSISAQKQERSLGTVPQLTHLLNSYTFATTMPAAQPLPLTESLWQNAASPTTKTMTLVGKASPKQHSFIKLISAESKQELMYAFIRQGDQLTLPWPEKKCLLKMATGEQWYGKRFLFGPKTEHGSAVVEPRKGNSHITLHLSTLATDKAMTPEDSF